MEKFKIVFKGLFLFLLFSAILFSLQWVLIDKGILNLNFRIHFLIFFITLISLLTLLVVFAIGKKNSIGFVFLGFVVFKFFAMGYIAVFQKEFKLNIIPYFIIYWIYLIVEVLFVLRLVKKQD